MFLTAAAAAARFLTIYHPEISICRSIHSESPPSPPLPSKSLSGERAERKKISPRASSTNQHCSTVWQSPFSLFYCCTEELEIERNVV